MSEPTRNPSTTERSVELSPEPAGDYALPLAAQEIRLVSALVFLLGIGLFLALPFVLSAGSLMFLPLIAAIILTIVLSPLADRITNLGLPNVVASALAVMIFIAFIVLALLLILQPALDMIDRIPAMAAKIQQQFAHLQSNFSWVNDINRQLTRMTGSSSTREVVVAAPSMIEQVAFATPAVVLELLLTLLMTFFMIESRVRMRRSLLLGRTSFGASLKAARVMRDVQDRVAAYILTVALINTGVGIITALGAWALGLEAPIMWGGLAALLNFLPYVGPLTMVVVLGVFGLGTSEGWFAGLLPGLAYLGLHAAESNAVTPSILGARFTLNPVLILLSISYFSWIWGMIGALLSIPILITLTALFEHLGKPNIVGFLFGEALFPSLPDLAVAEDEEITAAHVESAAATV